MTNTSQAFSPTLVVVGGPVGVGKSTAAQAAARLLRAQGVSVACMDLDLLFCMIRQREGFDDPATWQAAQRAAAVMADHCFVDVADVVIVEGGFLNAADHHQLVGSLQRQPQPRTVFVTLHATFEAVLQRVMADTDPGRVASKVPATLRQLYASYEKAQPYLRQATCCITAQGCALEKVAEQIAQRVLKPAR